VLGKWLCGLVVIWPPTYKVPSPKDLVFDPSDSLFLVFSRALSTLFNRINLSWFNVVKPGGLNVIKRTPLLAPRTGANADTHRVLKPD
jgi:hypothetical protein